MHPSNKVTRENIDDVFSYHNDQWKIFYYQQIREAARNLAHVIIESTPDCADTSAALRKLREAVMTANAAVALAKAPWK